MARTLSTGYQRTVNSQYNPDPVLMLLEITHTDLSVPIRIVNNTEAVTSNGNSFVPLAFQITLPDDKSSGLPRARLNIDNVGRELMTWLELSNGGQGAIVRIMQIIHSDPNTLEYDVTLNLIKVKTTVLNVTADLGYDDLLSRRAVVLRYDISTSPGLF